ncbi:MAG: hypothetical protein IT423_03715 [Pirellulaceae bacterium]|nr:hypothetical protein [Pirellulaceae bacterium]
MSHPRSAYERPTRSRAAFTLLELILVLSILVAIGAIVAPSVGEAFKRQKLQASVDRLRSQWDRARLTAMKTGQIQVFNCTLGESTFSVTPFMTGDDVLSAGAGATVMTSVGTVAETTSSGMLAAPTVTNDQTSSLEEEIIFVSCAVNGDMRAMTVAQTQGGMVGVAAMNQAVMFYPDGSTSTAEVIIQNPAGLQRAVRMRGLTGSTQTLTPGEVPVVAAPTAVP